MLKGIFILAVVILGGDAIAQNRMDSEVMLFHVNEARSQDCYCGTDEQKSAPPLQWDDALARAAQRHANDMARRDFFSHSGSDGSSVSQRVERQRFKWQMVGENIAMGYKSEADAVAGWMDSPGHCRNIMNAEFTHIGAAVSRNGEYWVQVFATPMEE